MKRTATAFWGVAIVASLVLAAPLANAQSRNEFRALLQRVEGLEKELQSLRRAGGAAPTQTNGGSAANNSLEALVERQETMGAQLDRQVREVTDTVERIRFEVSKLSRRMDKLVRDVDRRLSDLETTVSTLRQSGVASPGTDAAIETPTASTTDDAAGLVAGQEPAASDTVNASADTLPQGTPVEQYGRAQNLLKQLKFADAERALRDFIEAHPDHELADNSRYWLGETYYVRKDYESAARIFLEGYQANKKGRKAPDNLLKLGLSLRKLGQQEDACATLRELIEGYKLAAKPVLDRAKAEISDIGCT